MKKTIVISGASRGVGYATAQYFHERGWNVHGTATTQQGIDTLVGALPGVTATVCDVRDEASIKQTIDTAVSNYGSIDVLMNNVGIRCIDALEDIPSEQFNDVMEVNVGSAFLFTKYTVPHMRDAGEGRIININSLAGLQPYGNFGVYAASKYAMTGFAKSLRFEVHKDNIQVCNIYPGGIDTDFHSVKREGFMHVNEVAETIYFVANRPWNASIGELVLAPSRDARLP